MAVMVILFILGEFIIQQSSLLPVALFALAIALVRRFFKEIKYTSPPQQILNTQKFCLQGDNQSLSISTNFFPQDVLFEILSRLPVRSLLRFRSVSKSWRDMIKDPFFVTKHHLTQVALNNGNCVLTRDRSPMMDKQEFALLTKDEQEINFTFLELPFSFEPRGFWYDSIPYEVIYQVAGPCNGIVVISNGDDEVCLWNPATREYKAFPPASLNDSWAESNKLSRNTSNVGFGIDPITKHYKVVRVWHFNGYGGFSIDKAEVFSLSSNNSSCMWPEGGGESWKIIDDVAPAFLYNCRFNEGVYSNGKYYWFCGAVAEDKDGIVWFDMGAEVFGLLELPAPLFHDHPIGVRLTTMFKEGELCLAMISHAYKIEEENKNMCHIWIIADDDETGFSLTNYATVGPFSNMEVPLGFFGKEELVVFNTCCIDKREGKCVYESYVYNIKTRMKKKRMQGLEYDLCLQLSVYNENLVSVL